MSTMPMDPVSSTTSILFGVGLVVLILTLFFASFLGRINDLPLAGQIGQVNTGTGKDSRLSAGSVWRLALIIALVILVGILLPPLLF